MLEAEKGKVYAEAEKKILEEKYSELSVKLSEAEMHIQLLEKEARTSKNEAEQAEKKVSMEKMQLNEDIATLHLKEETARERAQEMETRVANLQTEAEKVEKEKNKEVASLEHQLSEARRQKQAVEEELRVVWKEMGRHGQGKRCLGCMRFCVDRHQQCIAHSLILFCDLNYFHQYSIALDACIQ